MKKPTQLYRYFDNKGNLLYVGVSVNTFIRMTQHRTKSAWFFLATRTEIENYKSRGEALKAERRAIKNENPAYNIALKNSDDHSVISYEEIEIDFKTGINEKCFYQKHFDEPTLEKVMHASKAKYTSDFNPVDYYLKSYDTPLTIKVCKRLTANITKNGDIRWETRYKNNAKESRKTIGHYPIVSKDEAIAKTVQFHAEQKIKNSYKRKEKKLLSLNLSHL